MCFKNIKAKGKDKKNKKRNVKTEKKIKWEKVKKSIRLIIKSNQYQYHLKKYKAKRAKAVAIPEDSFALRARASMRFVVRG